MKLNILPALLMLLLAASCGPGVKDKNAQINDKKVALAKPVSYTHLDVYKRQRNALLDIQQQKQTNREITSAALPQLSGSFSANYFPNVAVQSFPNFIAAATYGAVSYTHLDVYKRQQ